MGFDDATRSDRSAPRPITPGDLAAFTPARAEERYVDMEALGHGGMGELRGVQDEHLNRLVAMKVLRDEHTASPELVSRLHREAMIQGQLEHPSIVPVYEVGTFHGRPFFTMKRIRGSTLKELLNEQRRSLRSIVRFSRRRLLTAFSNVCMAVDFAHRRGIVHRDLKPSNLMLGDFGEVYVLDWGVAKFIDEEPTGPIDRTRARTGTVAAPPKLPAESGDELSSTGEVFGTPGYVAPEQLMGKAITERSDVFALGAILFELLSLEKLFEGDPQQRIDSTLRGTDVRARAARFDLPPELVRICAKAVATDPRDRYASAREMHDDLERFLDGDRDLELRRELAAKHAAASVEHADRAIEEASGADARSALWGSTREPDQAAKGGAPKTGELESRKQAMQEVSRALALDAGNELAVSTFVRLLTEPPKEIPEEVRARVERDATTNATGVLRGTMVVHIGVLLSFTPLILLLGVKSWTAFALLTALNAGAALVDLVIGRWVNTRRGTDLVFLTSILWTASLSVMFGPYFLVPGVAAINLTGYLLVRRGRGAISTAILGAATFLVPALAQWVGLLPPSYAFSDQGLIVLPVLHAFSGPLTHALLMLAGLGCIAATVNVVERSRRALSRAELRVHLQAWQLRQLLPIRTA